jgi:drug/metabolite transporter (DMT)-like permease
MVVATGIGQAVANPRRGIVYMLVAMIVFSVQDGLSRHLAEAANPVFVVAIRYWALTVFLLVLASRLPGGIRGTARTSRPLLQIGRGVLLAFEVIITVWVFTKLGLAASHAIFAIYPLLVLALSVPILGERVGWRRAGAVLAGFSGMLLILRPGLTAFQPAAAVALGAALLFALYGVLTRLAARHDSAHTSFFWTGIAGAVFMTAIVPFFWSSLHGTDWILMAILCVTGATGHFLLIKAYEASEAAILQPFSYVQLIFAIAIGTAVFGDVIDAWMLAGAAIIAAAGIYAFWRERQVAKRAPA